MCFTVSIFKPQVLPCTAQIPMSNKNEWPHKAHIPCLHIYLWGLEFIKFFIKTHTHWHETVCVVNNQSMNPIVLGVRIWRRRHGHRPRYPRRQNQSWGSAQRQGKKWELAILWEPLGLTLTLLIPHTWLKLWHSCTITAYGLVSWNLRSYRSMTPAWSEIRDDTAMWA